MLAISNRTSAFDRSVMAGMSRPVVARPETPIEDLARMLEDSAIVAIVDELESIVGVVSRIDLVATSTSRRRTHPYPVRVAADVMTPGAVTIPSSATLRAAACAMAAHGIHHVFVTDRRLLMGVVSGLDIVAAVRDAHVEAELSTIMTAPPIMISLGTEIGVAVDLLARVRVSGLVVVDDGKPMGTFTHLDAIAARDVTRSTPIDDVYEPAVLCLPATTPLYTVARQLVNQGTQRVIACAGREITGIATSLDFTRYVAW